MPPHRSTSQQLAHERIILAKTPAWLASPKRGAEADQLLPNRGKAERGSLLQRVAQSDVGLRQAASSPFPPKARTPEPLPSGYCVTSVGETTPAADAQRRHGLAALLQPSDESRVPTAVGRRSVVLPARRPSVAAGGAPHTPSPQRAPSPRKALWVPDLSDMDPFTLMERGLLEELSAFRAAPAQYFERTAVPLLAVQLPAVPSAAVDPAAPPTSDTLHADLLPKCASDVVRAARRLALHEQRRVDEQLVVAKRAGMGSELELLGAPHAIAHRCAAAQMLVPLRAAEQFVRQLGHHITGAKDPVASDAAAADEGAAPAKSSSKKAMAKEPSAARLTSGVSPAHRRHAAQVLGRVLDESAPRVQEALAVADHVLRAPAGATFASSSPTDAGENPVVAPSASWSLPRVGYNKGLCMAARDLAELLGRTGTTRPPGLTTVAQVASRYGKVTEMIHAYVVYGLWHDPETAVRELLLRWATGTCVSHPSVTPASKEPTIGAPADDVLLHPSKLFGGAGWQRHPQRGAVTVLLLASGYQEVAYIKQHRNLPIVELRRCFNLGMMATDERHYDLNFIPEHYGIRAVRPVTHPVKCGALVEVTVELPDEVLLSCSTESMAGGGDYAPRRSQTNVFVDRSESRIARIRAVLTQCDPCRLVVYARHPSDLVYRRSSMVLLQPDAALFKAEMRAAPGGVVPLFPEQLEWFQAVRGVLLSPRDGELMDAAAVAHESLRLQQSMNAAGAQLPSGVPLPQRDVAAMAAGGTLFSLRTDVTTHTARVTGAHGSVKLHRIACWATAHGAEATPRGDDAPDTAWYFAVVKAKAGAPVSLWIDEQCAALWQVTGS